MCVGHFSRYLNLKEDENRAGTLFTQCMPAEYGGTHTFCFLHEVFLFQAQGAWSPSVQA